MYTIRDFIKQVEQSNGIVCYGVGKRFRLFEEFSQEIKIFNKVIFCIDKKKELEGTQIDFLNQKLKIFSKEKLKDIQGKNVILIITNAQYKDILAELEMENYLQKINIFCLSHLEFMLLEEKAMNVKIPNNFKLIQEAIIPKIIHYCWFGKNPIPDKYKSWMESWKKFCPDYEIIEWNENNYDIQKNQYMYEAYQNKKWGFVPDYARLDIIYKYGGIYLDTDVELVKNLDDMLYQKGFAGFESNDFVNLGLGFGAVKHLPIIKQMRDQYNDMHFITSNDGKLVASPHYQTGLLQEKGLQLNGEYQIVEDLVIYPEKMFSGKSIKTQRIRLNDYTKSIHHYDGSWIDEEAKSKVKEFEKEIDSLGYIKMRGNL